MVICFSSLVRKCSTSILFTSATQTRLNLFQSKSCQRWRDIPKWPFWVSQSKIKRAKMKKTRVSTIYEQRNTDAELRQWDGDNPIRQLISLLANGLLNMNRKHTIVVFHFLLKGWFIYAKSHRWKLKSHWWKFQFPPVGFKIPPVEISISRWKLKFPPVGFEIPLVGFEIPPVEIEISTGGISISTGGISRRWINPR